MAIATSASSALYQSQKKSVFIAIVLAFFFPVLGMLYSTVLGAIVMFLLTSVLGIVTGGFALLILLPLSWLWAGLAVRRRNLMLAGALEEVAARRA